MAGMDVGKSLLAALFVLSGLDVRAEMIDHAARTSSRDIGVPRGLVERVETDYQAFLESEGVQQKQPVRRSMLNVRVEFTQKRPGALHEDVRVLTPLGGGVVDLADLVTPVRGAFDAKIMAFNEDGSQPSDLKVYFVSRARERTIAGETYGAGCDKWMDVTHFFEKAMKSSGFQLYTADQRYLSVLGGTFVLLEYTKEAISVGSVTFTDSRYHQLLCE